MLATMHASDANTDEKPLIAHAHGTSCGDVASSARTPVGNGMPSAMPIGASNSTTASTRTPKLSPSSIGGNHAQLLASIRERLFPLGDDVTFLPGHGPTSTFGEERRSNPYVADELFRR